MRKRNAYKNAEPMAQDLTKLGFTVDEAKTYVSVLKSGSLTATEIAKKIAVLPNAVYRLVEKLEDKGFIISLGTYPLTFQAVPYSVAVNSYTTQKQKELESMKTNKEDLNLESNVQSPNRVDVLVSQKSFFDKFVELTNQAKSEVLTISIGEPVPDEIKIACVRARERGVSIKFIFHVHNKKNDDLLKSWVRMGMEVRHYADSGYHLTVADGKVGVLVANNPQNTMDRIGMVYHNERLANSLKDYFYQIWERSQAIKA